MCSTQYTTPAYLPDILSDWLPHQPFLKFPLPHLPCSVLSICVHPFSLTLLLPHPLLISSFTSLHPLCVPPSSLLSPLLLLPSHSCHPLPTSPFPSLYPPLFTRRSSSCWLEYRSWNSWLDNIIFYTNSIRCQCQHWIQLWWWEDVRTSRLWITCTSDVMFYKNCILWMNSYYSIMYMSYEFSARIQLLHHQICIV